MARLRWRNRAGACGSTISGCLPTFAGATDYFEDELVKTRSAGGDRASLIAKRSNANCQPAREITGSNQQSAIAISQQNIKGRTAGVKKSVVSCGAIILMLALGVSAQRPTHKTMSVPSSPAALLLAPTDHPRIPGDLNLLWLAAHSVRSIETLPSSREIATAIKLVDKGRARQSAGDALAALSAGRTSRRVRWPTMPGSRSQG